MNTLISSTASPCFGQVRTLLLHAEALPLMNLSLMLRSKTVQPIKTIADFGGIESVAVASLAYGTPRANERHPTQSALLSPSPPSFPAERCANAVAGVPRRFRWQR